jgi:pyruvate carboxylase
VLAIEMDHVIGIFGDPNFGFPRELRQKGLHGATSLEGRHEHQTRRAASEETFKVLAAL